MGGFTVFLLIFSALFAGFFALICSALPKKAGRIASILLSFGLFFFYSVKLVYQHIFKSYLSISQVGMGGDALKSFGTETLIGVGECAGYLFVLALPFIAVLVLQVLAMYGNGKHAKSSHLISAIGDEKIKSLSGKGLLISFAILVALQLAVPLALPLLGEKTYGPADIYNETFILSMSERYFGALTSSRLELRNIFFGKGSASIVAEAENEEPEHTTEAAIEEPELTDEEKYGLNILDLDFTKEGDEDLKAIDEYFSSRKASPKNAYTGMFEGYNLVMILCESFSPYLIDEERTPLLYEMSNNGFVFNDYYDTICDNTSNSEYVLTTGLLPDTSLLGKGWETFYDYNSCTASKKNYLPLTIGNQFTSLGIKSWGFHNYWGTYYGRKETHPNFGYDFQYMGHGFVRKEGMPSSDLEMMEQAMPMLLTPGEDGKIAQFSAYFLTFSGHMQYRFDTNAIAAKNKAVSEGLDISTAARAYVSCNQELEYALEYMKEAFEEAGVWENTLFLITPDHYPYTLGLEKLSEIAGKDLASSDFERYINQYKGSLILWSPSMTEKVEIDYPVCELDILPTLSNLMGLDFDSRLLMGTDALSDSQHIAILQDRSFVTEKYYYNASNNSIISRFSDEDIPDESTIQRYIDIIKNKFTVSNQVLYTDYYRHLWN